ncbi:hypothetical protein P43SY_004483 [Pythium insidiosum]|uniref:Uncharacterized protein n=1 Tax=Pythium insidiosum TaxID=114742 RepID=A0AAD5Q6I1_PYTIN|nr:hypothetical protein P43SY_004483 [Pythium insidiosum]
MSSLGLDVQLADALDSSSASSSSSDAGLDLDPHRTRCDTFDDLELSDVDDVEMADLDVDFFRPSAWTLAVDGNSTHSGALLFQAPPQRGLLCALAAQTAPFVVPTQRWEDASGSASSHAVAIAATLPPKYLESSTHAPRKRRALCRTLGVERMGRFSFESMGDTSSRVRASVGSTSMNDENVSPEAEPTPLESAVSAKRPIAASLLSPPPAPTAAFSTPSRRRTPQRRRPRSSITSSNATTPLLMARSTSTDAASSSPATPLRRTVSTPCSHAFLTPVTPANNGAKSASFSVSPFEKAALVHAKDTPGKVDKFEWRIRSNDGRQSRVPGATFLPVGVGAALENKQSTTDALSLPPPYLHTADPSESRRRVHSTTFGAFARSFSFTSTPTSR